MRQRQNTKKSLFKKMFIPLFEEHTIFLISFSLFFIIIVNKGALDAFGDYLSYSLSPFSYLLLLGFFLSIYNLFSERKKGLIERYILIIYVMSIFLNIGFSSTAEAISNGKGILIVFPIINFFYLLMAAILLRIGKINHKSVSTQNRSFLSAIPGMAISSVIIFYFSHSSNLSWKMILSITFAYLEVANSFVEKIFFKKTNQN